MTYADGELQASPSATVGSGIPTAVIAERYKAGESIADLAEDYGEDPLNIEEAVRCELQPAKAA